MNKVDKGANAMDSWSVASDEVGTVMPPTETDGSSVDNPSTCVHTNDTFDASDPFTKQGLPEMENTLVALNCKLLVRRTD